MAKLGQLAAVVWLIRRRSFSLDNLKLTPMQVSLSCFPTFVIGAKRISLVLLCSTLDIRELKEGMIMFRFLFRWKHLASSSRSFKFANLGLPGGD